MIECYDLPYLEPLRHLPESVVRHLTKHSVQALSPPVRSTNLLRARDELETNVGAAPTNDTRIAQSLGPAGTEIAVVVQDPHPRIERWADIMARGACTRGDS